MAPRGHYRWCPHRKHDFQLDACPGGQRRTLTLKYTPVVLVSRRFRSLKTEDHFSKVMLTRRPSRYTFPSVPRSKHQRCRSLCFWKFVSLHPICKIEVHLLPESFLSIREYASYYRLPLLRRVVGQYIEIETLPYLNFGLHLKSLYVLSF